MARSSPGPGGSDSVGRAVGDVEATTAHGHVRIGQIEGQARIKNLSGPIELGRVTGELRLSGANGNISVDQAHAGVAGKTVNGDLRIGEIRCGSVSLETAAGSIDIGVREGTSAYLDMQSLVGGVHNWLSDADGPVGSGDTVKVSARTQLGTIEVRRSLLGRDSGPDSGPDS